MTNATGLGKLDLHGGSARAEGGEQPASAAQPGSTRPTKTRQLGVERDRIPHCGICGVQWERCDFVYANEAQGPNYRVSIEEVYAPDCECWRRGMQP